MRKLTHPHIVQYYGAQTLTTDQDECLEIFIEYCPGGSLTSLRRRIDKVSGKLPIKLVREYTRQALEGLRYLHEQRLVHRDIKGDNLLIGARGEVKLADFGCSKRIDTLVSHTHGCRTFVVTPFWLAPEVILRVGAKKPPHDGGVESPQSEDSAGLDYAGYGTPADIWSMGCVVLEMLGRNPWPKCANMWSTIYTISQSHGAPTGTPKNCEPKLSSFFSSIFQRDPSRRHSAVELLQHDWMVCPPGNCKTQWTDRTIINIFCYRGIFMESKLHSYGVYFIFNVVQNPTWTSRRSPSPTHFRPTRMAHRAPLVLTLTMFP